MLTHVLPKSGIIVFTSMRIDEITDEGVVATDKAWRNVRFEADTVVIAMGYAVDTTLYEALKGEVLELYRIGDCVKPRRIADAVREAAYIARQI